MQFLRRSLKHVSIETELDTNKMIVYLLLEYACEVWTLKKTDEIKLENVQILALLFIFLKFHRPDSVSNLCAKTELQLLVERCQENSLKRSCII